MTQNEPDEGADIIPYSLDGAEPEAIPDTTEGVVRMLKLPTPGGGTVFFPIAEGGLEIPALGAGDSPAPASGKPKSKDEEKALATAIDRRWQVSTQNLNEYINNIKIDLALLKHKSLWTMLKSPLADALALR